MSASAAPRGPARFEPDPVQREMAEGHLLSIISNMLASGWTPEAFNIQLSRFGYQLAALGSHSDSSAKIVQ